MGDFDFSCGLLAGVAGFFAQTVCVGVCPVQFGADVCRPVLDLRDRRTRSMAAAATPLRTVMKECKEG
jgi:hypothetical protein